MGLPLTLVIAGVDERHRPFDQLHVRDVARSADLQDAEPGRAVDDFSWID